MKNILFLHGFFASGGCELANTLKDALNSRINVLSPDLPINPQEALLMIQNICNKESINLLVGNSCGSFYAQILSPVVGVPALLGNPHFKMTDFLEKRKGIQHYKSIREDGIQNFCIDDKLIEKFAKIEKDQFSNYNSDYKDKIWGIFGEKDQVANFEKEFLKYYSNAFHFPGAHTPTREEVMTWYIPLIETMLNTYTK